MIGYFYTLVKKEYLEAEYTNDNEGSSEKRNEEHRNASK